MDYAFFESLTVKQARELLAGFLRSESTAVEAMRDEAARDGIVFDFSMESLPAVLKWFLARVTMHRVPPSPETPEWVRKTYKDGLVAAFDEDAKPILLRAGYYLGETFVRSSSQLDWTCGNRKTLLQNMPVVSGFKHKKELAPILVIENNFGAVAGDGEALSRVDRMIASWCNELP